MRLRFLLPVVSLALAIFLFRFGDLQAKGIAAGAHGSAFEGLPLEAAKARYIAYALNAPAWALLAQARNMRWSPTTLHRRRSRRRRRRRRTAPGHRRRRPAPTYWPAFSAAASSYSFWLKLWLAVISFSVAGLDGLDVVAGERVLQVGERRLDGRLLVAGDLVALLARAASRSGTRASRRCCGSRPLPALAVVLGVGLGVADHLVDVVLVERRLTGDRHRLLLAGGPVLGRHVHDAVGVDVEGDLDLRHATGRRRQVDELELAERLVVTAPSRARPAARGSRPTAACPRRW